MKNISVITRLLPVFFLAFLVYSCKKDKVVELSIDYSYFPSVTGSWIIYNIEEINIDVQSTTFDTSTYQIKEVVESLYMDTTGHETMRIERYSRPDEASPWVIKDVWTAQVNKVNAQKTEENIRYIKLVFPLTTGKTWDGNAYNVYNPENYEIVNIDRTENIGGLSLDSVLTVSQVYDSSLVSLKNNFEKYAKNIGLVQKHELYVYSIITNFNPTLPIMERITTCKYYNQVAVDYGN